MGLGFLRLLKGWRTVRVAMALPVAAAVTRVAAAAGIRAAGRAGISPDCEYWSHHEEGPAGEWEDR
ncbi:UNVERIFIED_CONTAM: hypothetical protein Sangu_0720300 [Sesamum angustifolium]|uniref:Uncharacterized protein n=1 Tax=Sesamum angustifolium TaxID=2727405 RepID=A0AAW2PSK9_9LAMI